jgi:heterodisulfide reductase subunit A-like polyferredoxin
MKTPKFIPDFADLPAERTKMPELPLAERALNFSEVELGFTEELARREAARCLSCRRCIGCGLCLAECERCAIVYDEKETSLSIEADAVIFTSDGDVFSAGRKREFGYGTALDVITSFELERLASPSGPFGGLVARPFDGEIPRRIDFIQCVGSRDETIGANYCSADCCSRTLAEARRAREIIADAEVRVFHKGLRPVGKTAELELRRLEGEKWIGFTQATVTSVKEDPATGAVTVRYARGDKETEEVFDLVVLAVGIQARRDFRRYARSGGATLNKYGFVDSGVVSQLARKDGVAYAGAILGPQSAGRSVIDAVAAASEALSSPPAAEPEAPVGIWGSVGAKPLVYACEYGLRLAGKDAAFIENLKENLKANGIGLAGVFPFLCYKEGREDMKRQSPGATGILVLGCHSGSHERLFERTLGTLSGGVWIAAPTDLAGDAGAVASRLAAMRASETGDTRGAGSGELGEAGPCDTGATAPAEAAPVVAILGGGVAGLAAASELVRRDVKVVVIEKSGVLGSGFSKALITGEPADAKVLEDFIDTIEASPGVRVVTLAHLAALRREGGALSLDLAVPDSKLTIGARALIIATGAEPYVPAKFGYGEWKPVITQDDFRTRLAAGDLGWKHVVMLQCVGARDAEHPYCSRFCCREALVNAVALKHADPSAEVTILHKGIRVYGLDEEILSDAIERGVRLIEIATEPDVAPSGSKVKVIVRGRSTAGEGFNLDCDALVLSVAHSRDGDGKEVAAAAGAALDGLGFFETQDPLTEPFATRAEGVFVCGFARGPVTIEEAFREGRGAAGAVCQYIGRRRA